jgi:hypothetical protein
MITINLLTITRTCTTCKRELPLSAFGLHPGCKYGRNSRCKECSALYKKEYDNTHKEERAAYEESVKDQKHEYNQRYYEENKEDIKAQHVEYYNDNKEATAAHNKLYRQEHKEEIAAKKHEYYEENKEEIAVKKRVYCEENKEAIAEHSREYIKKRYGIDPVYRLVKKLRARCRAVLKGISKSAPTLELLGGDGKFVIDELEKLFWPGMTRDDKEWCIDHIIPLDHFDLVNPEEQWIAFHYTNLQPLWEDDNLVKWDTLDWTPAESKHPLPDWIKNDPEAYQKRVDFVLDKLNALRLSKAA